jgi:hypothetical protein
MAQVNKSGPTGLRRLQHILTDLDFLENRVLRVLAAVLVMHFAVRTSRQIFFRLNDVPTVYLVIIATAVGLAIAISIGFVIYRWRVAVKRNMIRELRTTEADLFQRIQARLPDLLGGKL